MTTGEQRKLWKVIHQLTGQKKSEQGLQGLTNKVCDGDEEVMVTKINQAFHQITADLVPLTPVDIKQVDGPVLEELIISVNDVEKSLMNIKVSKAVGPDAIPNWELRDIAGILSAPICAMFNSSISQSSLPSVWKSADVIPLPKVANPDCIKKDIRPISLTPVLSKILERFVCDTLWKYMEPTVDRHQFGAIKGCSTTTALVDLLHTLYEACDKPKFVLLDFAKAFDHIDHRTLLRKFQGMPEHLFSWLSAFLLDRKQRVKMGNITSEWIHINGGVPQGTVVGPRAFMQMMIDLATVVNHYKYVDDTTLVEQCFLSDKQPVNNMQVACQQAADWARQNKMNFNASKTKLYLY